MTDSPDHAPSDQRQAETGARAALFNSIYEKLTAMSESAERDEQLAAYRALNKALTEGPDAISHGLSDADQQRAADMLERRGHVMLQHHADGSSTIIEDLWVRGEPSP